MRRFPILCGTPNLGFNAVGGAWCEDKADPYQDKDDKNEWIFADVYVDSHVSLRASLHRYFDAIYELCWSANVAALENERKISRLALKDLNVMPEPKSVVTTRIVALERLHIVEETVAALVVN